MNKVLETMKKAFGTVKDKWMALSRKVRIGIIAGVSVLAFSLIVLIIIMSQTGYKVIFSGASDTEAQEILSAIQNDLGVNEVRITSDGDILVPEEKAEDIRVQLSVLGYPKNAFNYDIFDSVGMFSTETVTRQKQVQQLQQLLMATLDTISGVDYSYVLLNIPDDVDYVLTSSKIEASASVILHLDGEITADTVDGIYKIVKTAVPGLKEENITVTDGDGVPLSAELMAEEPEDEDEIALYYRRFNFQTELQNILEESLGSIFEGVFNDYRVVVNVALNYDKEVSSSTEYTPSVDEEGTSGGMIQDEEYVSAGGGQATVGGVVGTTIDSDISPDYPTIEADEDGDIYWETSKKIHRLVNEATKQVEKDGYSYQNLSASVLVDSAAMTTAELEKWEEIVANAIGSDTISVSFFAQPFALRSTGGDSETDPMVVTNNNRTLLIFTIIGLGILLLMLLFFALMAANSSKKKIKVRQQGAAAAAGAAGSNLDITIDSEYDDESDYDAMRGFSDRRGEEMLDLPSLTEQDTSNSREIVLKREIRDFSKTNPEIVAQLIRTWIRGED